MRVLVDEDVPVQLLEPIRHLARGHEFAHVDELRWKRKSDIQLYADAARAGYDAVVTNDRGQLEDPEILRAIKRSRLHHIRYSHKHKGIHGLALALGALIAALPGLLDELADTDGQRLARVEGLDPRRRRWQIIDPASDPPAYWSRRTPR